MSLDKPEAIDAIGTEKDSGIIVLSLFDHWGWEDELGHLLALQDKINMYLQFIESGQIKDEYSISSTGEIRIDVIAKYCAPEKAVKLFEIARAAASNLNVDIRYRHVPES